MNGPEFESGGKEPVTESWMRRFVSRQRVLRRLFGQHIDVSTDGADIDVLESVPEGFEDIVAALASSKRSLNPEALKKIDERIIGKN